MELNNYDLISVQRNMIAVFHSFTFFGYFVWDFLHMICKFHSANSFGIDFSALFLNKHMTLLNGFCSVQLLGVLDTMYNCWVWWSS